MDIVTYRNYCLAKPGVTEGFPFDNKVLVFKVMGKMFALTDVDTFASVNLKCDPELAIELRERHPAVLPGYHMNKQLWNTVMIDGTIPDNTLLEWIDMSYSLIVESLPRKKKEELQKLL